MPLAVLAVLSVTGLEEMENFREEEMGLSKESLFHGSTGWRWSSVGFSEAERMLIQFCSSWEFCDWDSAVFFPAAIVVSIEIIGL